MAILGFSEFERDALSFCIRNAPAHPASPARYELVDEIAGADLIVADSDAAGVIERIVLAARSPHVVFVGRRDVPGAACMLPRPIDPTRVLRGLDELAAEVLQARIMAWAEPGTVTQPDIPRAPDVPVEVIIAGDAASPGSEARMAARAKTRAAVRRARQAVDDDVGAAPTDVLLLDDNDDDRAALATLLDLFGFVVYLAGDAADALRQLGEREFVVVFADVALDGSDGDEGIGLCRRVKALKSPPVLVLVSRSAGAADQVRAMLAGADAQLDKPVTRGEVARTLEDRGVRFPADARRA